MYITVQQWSLEVGVSYPLEGNGDFCASPGVSSIKTPLALKHLFHHAPFLSTTLIAPPLLQALGTNCSCKMCWEGHWLLGFSSTSFAWFNCVRQLIVTVRSTGSDLAGTQCRADSSSFPNCNLSVQSTENSLRGLRGLG